MVADIIIFKDMLEINNVTKLKTFNKKEILLDINNEGYLIKGNDFDLKEFKNNNTTLLIYGSFYSIEKNKKYKEKSFLKRLFA